MSYIFDGVDDDIHESIGANNYRLDVTIAVIAKFAAGRDGAWNALTTALSSGAAPQGHGLDKTNANKIGFLNDGGTGTFSTTTTTSSDNWCLHVATKTAGNTTPKYHRYKFDTTTWVTAESFSANQANPTAPGASGGIEIGGDTHGAGDWCSARIAVVAYWNSVLSDANILTLISTFTRANWLSLTPTGLWDATDQFATDQTGNGANRTSITGTTSSADDPTGWASWAGATTSLPIPRQHPERGLAIRSSRRLRASIIVPKLWLPKPGILIPA